MFATRQRAPEELTTTAGSGGGRGTAAAAVVYGKCGGDERAEGMRIWRERGLWGGEEGASNLLLLQETLHHLH
ncbi:unnamed protein product, partial [marine sediment metagenome]